MPASDANPRGRPSTGAPDDVVDADLTTALGRLARDLASDPDRSSVLDTVLEATLANVDGADHASVSVATRKHTGRTVAATSTLASQVDQLQYELQEGPCLDTLFDHVTVRSGSLDTDGRWPRFAPQAAEAGVQSMLSVQLFTDGRNLGAINIFGEARDAFSHRSETAGLALAAHAAVAVAAADEIDHLKVAVESRDLIGQAKGILMERHHVDEDVAFSVLVRYSRDNNIRLVDIARNVVKGTGVRPGA